MRKRTRPIAALVPLWLPLLLATAALPAPASAQTERAWVVVPMLGFGVVSHGGWGSAGMEAALELEHRGTGWRWSGWGSLRGLGVGCSHACFDGGPAFAAGGARSLGPLWIGGGAGAMKQLGRWRFLPYGRASLDMGSVRLDVRVELPQQEGVGPYVPFLVGLPLLR